MSINAKLPAWQFSHTKSPAWRFAQIVRMTIFARKIARMAMLAFPNVGQRSHDSTDRTLKKVGRSLATMCEPNSQPDGLGIWWPNRP